MSAIAVIDTTTANLASVFAGLRRVDLEPTLTHDPAVIRDADRVMLPGVGAFGAGMRKLRAEGLVEVLRERIAAGRPFIAICLGLQLLCEASEETVGVEGLGVLPLRVGRFVEPKIVPQLGWNKVVPEEGCATLTEGYAYFANSYRITEIPDGWHGAVGIHGERFVAAVERGSQLACQFHPELSGAWGQALLERWRDAC